MKVAKKHLEVLFNITNGTNGVLNLADSRSRDKFIKPLAEATDAFFKERTAIYEAFCDKDEDGKPDIKDGSYHFDPTKLEEINKELTTLYAEEVELESPEKLKEFLDKSEYKPKVGEVELIDEILAKI